MEKNIGLDLGKCRGAYHKTIYYGHDGPVKVSYFTDGEKVVGVTCPFRDENQLCQAYKTHGRLGGLFNRIYLFFEALTIIATPTMYLHDTRGWPGGPLSDLWKPQARKCDSTLIQINNVANLR